MRQDVLLQRLWKTRTNTHEKVEDHEQSSEQQQQQNMMAQNMMPGMGQGMNGVFGNMGFNGMGDMNQMMQMMQGGMPNPMMAGLPNMMGECNQIVHLRTWLTRPVQACLEWAWIRWRCKDCTTTLVDLA